MPKISFSTHPEILDVIPHPRPATKFVPDWYKEMEARIDCVERDVIHAPTLKACMPVRDYITSGYIIPSWQDIAFRKDKNNNYRNITDYSPAMADKYNMSYGAHDPMQVQGSPLAKFADGEKMIKLNNPWMIRTPKGYSTLFMSPFYDEIDITILPAIVDTDLHDIQINFPCIITSENAFVEKGAPLIHAIPFKRDDWKSEVKAYDEKETFKSHIKFSTTLQSFYTKFFWQRKRYR